MALEGTAAPILEKSQVSLPVTTLRCHISTALFSKPSWFSSPSICPPSLQSVHPVAETTAEYNAEAISLIGTEQSHLFRGGNQTMYLLLNEGQEGLAVKALAKQQSLGIMCLH